MQRCAGIANKLRYLNTIRGTPRDIAIKDWEINNIKIKLVSHLLYSMKLLLRAIFINEFKDFFIAVSRGYMLNNTRIIQTMYLPKRFSLKFFYISMSFFVMFQIHI